MHIFAKEHFENALSNDGSDTMLPKRKLYKEFRDDDVMSNGSLDKWAVKGSAPLSPANEEAEFVGE